MLVTSLQVAKDFRKEHRHVLESVRDLVAKNSVAKAMFHESTYENRGKQYPMYTMNRDGFTLLAMGLSLIHISTNIKEQRESSTADCRWLQQFLILEP